jgi:UDP-N-acetylmuramoyl-tripeptide--D-alanyl-D-alanine ligase
MTEKIKFFLYFPIANYFKFFAQIFLKKWHPQIVVVTGSSGKTTLLHLLESQIGNKAKYSHHANSSYGIPFDILDLHRKSFQLSEWFGFILQAPIKVFQKPPKEKIYVVEADCDRPEEGKFLSALLNPDIVLLLNVFRTHSMNFDYLVRQNKYKTVDDAIAYEFGFFLQNCKKLALTNGDLSNVVKQEKRSHAKIVEVTRKNFLNGYSIEDDKTKFTIKNQHYSFNALLPEEMFYSIAMCKEVTEQLGLSFDPSFHDFLLPQGRSTLFKGIKNTTIVDSSYNGNLSSTEAVLKMFEKLPAKVKWVVLGDMLELGESEKEEHEKLAKFLASMHLEKIVLYGRKTAKYTAAKLPDLGVSSKKIITVQSLKEVNTYLHEHLNGGEAILFKGSQSMLLEGVIEGLLKNKDDANKLPRREVFWQKRREKMLS